MLEKRPRDGKVPLRGQKFLQGEIYITSPLNRERIVKFNRLFFNRERNNDIKPVSFGKHWFNIFIRNSSFELSTTLSLNYTYTGMERTILFLKDRTEYSHEECKNLFCIFGAPMIFLLIVCNLVTCNFGLLSL